MHTWFQIHNPQGPKSQNNRRVLQKDPDWPLTCVFLETLNDTNHSVVVHVGCFNISSHLLCVGALILPLIYPSRCFTGRLGGGAEVLGV